jgi:proteic killer suppression protein
MIKTFKDEETRLLFETGRSRRLPPEILKRAKHKLEYIDGATCLDDLREPYGNRLHGLGGDRMGQYSISVNKQWRVSFRFRDGDAYDVQIVDYH